MTRWFLGCAALALATLSVAEAGEVLSSVSPRAFLAVLDREEGEATLDIVIGGDTTIEGRIDDQRYAVYFYDCDGAGFDAPAGPDSACLGYEFRTYFAGIEADAEWVNEWNDENHYGALWLDHEGDVAVQLNMIVEGGVTEGNLSAAFTWWRRVLASARTHLGVSR